MLTGNMDFETFTNALKREELQRNEEPGGKFLN